MRTWRSKLLHRWLESEQERWYDLDASVGAHQGGLIPICTRCSKLAERKVCVQDVTVTNWGNTDGEPWTESKARCHMAEDVIRIPGVDWGNAFRWSDSRRQKIMAAMSLIPYFADGLEKDVKIRRLTYLLSRSAD